MKATGHEISCLSVPAVPRSFSKADRRSCGVGIETVRVGFAAGSWFCDGEDVSVLRIDHAAGETFLPGMREVAGSRSFDKIRGTVRARF
jgi:hypothetical protein